MSHKLRRKDIRGRTEEYWERWKGNYHCYIEELLGRELAWADTHPLPGCTPRLCRLAKPIHALAMTVGESFEPLLQVICVLKPTRLILILNEKYGTTDGRDHGDSLCRLVRKLSMAPDLPKEFEPDVTGMSFDLVKVKADTPTEVFRALRDALQDPEAQPQAGWVNAVDITGAKKSMVVGAFLYAAHSALPITYVDFDEYNSDFGRPYGYKCRIGQIADPYEAFQLRDWEQVRQLYRRYNFRGARELIGTAATEDGPGLGILGAMSSHLAGNKTVRKLYDPEDIAKVEKLLQILQMYEAWDNGEFRQAKKLADAFQPALPSDVVPWAVSVLGDIWPNAVDVIAPGDAARQLLDEHLKLKRGETKPSDSIFAQPVQLLAYVRDELAKIERLIAKNEDYRSTFLRAAGLHEFMLKARLALCWLNNGLEARLTGASDWQSVGDFGEAEKDAFESLVETSNEWKLREALKSNPPEAYNVKGGNVRRSVNAPCLEPYGDGLSLDLETLVHDEGARARPVFVKLRGETVHTHLYIPHHVAKAAVDLVQAAVIDFETKWLEHFHPCTSQVGANMSVICPKWSKLCTVCRLSFLPPQLRD
jgi:hypothetical protein